jgi:hypothetical protein
MQLSLEIGIIKNSHWYGNDSNLTYLLGVRWKCLMMPPTREIAKFVVLHRAANDGHRFCTINAIIS